MYKKAILRVGDPNAEPDPESFLKLGRVINGQILSVQNRFPQEFVRYQYRDLLWPLESSVPDTDGFLPPGSGSVIILYESGSFQQQTKKLIKTLISAVSLINS
jgi:hypothetical protein